MRIRPEAGNVVGMFYKICQKGQERLVILRVEYIGENVNFKIKKRLNKLLSEKILITLRV